MKRSILASIAFLLLTPALAWGVGPSTGVWLHPTSGVEMSAVSSNNPDAVFRFSDVATANSKLIHIKVSVAYAWFTPDTAATGGTAVISLYRAMYSDTCSGQVPVIGRSAILAPAVPVDHSNGVQLLRGCYWVEITVAADTGDLAELSISAQIDR